MRALLPESGRGQWPPADGVAAPRFRALVALRFHPLRPHRDWATKDGRQPDLDHFASAIVLDTRA